MAQELKVVGNIDIPETPKKSHHPICDSCGEELCNGDWGEKVTVYSANGTIRTDIICNVCFVDLCESFDK